MFKRYSFSQEEINTLSTIVEQDISKWVIDDFFTLTKECEEHNNREYCRWDSWKREYKYDFPLLKICQNCNDFNLLKKLLMIVYNSEETKFYIEEIIQAFTKNKIITTHESWGELMRCVV